ncbi:MAG: amino acid ABC transporter substrate-binding protein [Deferribacterales bacterium]|nr:amino acid ABC transporter substrate-binding protein [Deferribacterales bacterium]
MKKMLVLALCLVAFALIGCKKQQSADVKAPAEEAKKTTFIVGLDDSFPPMGFRDSNNEIVGFDVDLAREVAKRLGLDLVLQPIDWNSKELELENNNIDCIWNGLSHSPARAEAMLLSKPYLANQMIIIVKADSGITSKDQLEGKNVAVQAGSTALQALENDPISTKVKKVEYENNVLALSDLKIGRADAVIMDEVVARYQIAQEKDLYSILGDSLSQEVYVIGFKKGNTELHDKVAAALAEMAADGTSDAISTTWFGEAIMMK